MSAEAELFANAVAHLQAGRWREAEAIYREIIAGNPQHAPAHYMLGICARGQRQWQQAAEEFRLATLCDGGQAEYFQCWGGALLELGRYDEAVRACGQAIDLDPGCIAAYFHLGHAYQAQGNLPAAAASFRELLRRAAHHAETHNDLASVLRALKDDVQAEHHFRQAIALRADFAPAYNNLGNLLLDRGELPAAITALETATRLRPDVAPAHFNLANALRAASHLSRAVDSYRRSIQLDPASAPAHNNLGTLLRQLDDPIRAEAALREAIRLDASYGEAFFNLAQLRQQQEQLVEARDLYRRAIELLPDYATAHYNLGTVLHALRDWPAAEACYRDAIRLDRANPQPHTNLGTMCQAAGDDDAALAHFDAALAIDPLCAEAHCNRGMLLLSQGNFAAGWPEYRWLAECGPCRPRGPQPAWDGSRLAGRRVLVRCDQGIGDALQFVRYLPCVWQRGAGEVYLSAAQSLHPLLAASSVQNLVTPETLPDFDVQISIMMLPALFHDEARTMADSVPYLRPSEELVQEWKAWLAPHGGFKVGICWQGSRRFAWDHLRSVPLAALEPLARLPHVRLISLQRGAGSEELAEQADRMNVMELPADFDTAHGAFMDTAAVMRCLDLVITTDTAIAHLAGALGIPAWVALGVAPEWRWERQGEASRWYPSLRLFRQSARGDWHSVFTRMAEELHKLCEPQSRSLVDRHGGNA